MEQSVKRVSRAEFFHLLCEQALISRTEGVDFYTGWSSPEQRLAALDKEWSWLSAIIARFIEAVLDLCDKENARVVIYDTSPGNRFTGDLDNILENMRNHLFTKHLIGWAGHAANAALKHSPAFREVTMEFGAEYGPVYRFSHHNGWPCFERVRNTP